MVLYEKCVVSPLKWEDACLDTLYYMLLTDKICILSDILKRQESIRRVSDYLYLYKGIYEVKIPMTEEGR